MKKNEELTRISESIKKMIDYEVDKRIKQEEKYEEKFYSLKTEIDCMLDEASSNLEFYKTNNFPICAAEEEGFRRCLLMLKEYAETL